MLNATDLQLRIDRLTADALAQHGPGAVWLYLHQPARAGEPGYQPEFSAHASAADACHAADALLLLNSGTIDPSCPSCGALRRGAALRIWPVVDGPRNLDLLACLARVANVSRETVRSELNVTN